MAFGVRAGFMCCSLFVFRCMRVCLFVYLSVHLSASVSVLISLLTVPHFGPLYIQRGLLVLCVPNLSNDFFGAGFKTSNFSLYLSSSIS